jgi:FKBP-type peptidyl-prolyl cis-trans isomerase FkpA
MSVTRVPIQPVKKNSMLKLWGGLALGVAAAVGLAWAGTSQTIADKGSPEQFLAWNKGQSGVKTTASGLQYKIIKKGEGPSPTEQDVALVAYKGTLRDGTVFDQNEQAPLPVGGMIPGFTEGLKLMNKGAKFKFWIPPAIAYGEQSPAEVIPPNSLLVFDVELKDFRSQQEVQMMQQQMQQMQGGPGGAPQGQ